MKHIDEPAQPDSKEWAFISELKVPGKHFIKWFRKAPEADDASLLDGIRIVSKFPDESGVLQTAFSDLNRFFDECGISRAGSFEIIAESGGTASNDDSFEMNVSKTSCRIIAGNTEGIRRGIFYLEDALGESDGPFLKVGAVQRSPWMKDRISRCFFGPVKRPPLNRDELADDSDYYPEEYLNRLAHEGVNGLWLTIEFKDLCKTSVTPEYGVDAEKRLEKLGRTVDKCLRYGIRIFVFCIEPLAWNPDNPILRRHPELGGGRTGGKICFCPFSEIAGKYLYEAVNGIFTAVPKLGGMINISHGERPTTCLSSVRATENGAVNCPVCAERGKWEILHSSLSAMEKGMHDASPHAQLISWLYMPQPGEKADWVFEVPKHVPDRVVLQYNFESGGMLEQLGRKRCGGDYWLSYAGPSEDFSNVAKSARMSQTEMSAKIQVGCSHEVATVPFVPVPGLLYRKYREMHELGVSGVMQCWYFGNYPGLMNRAAGMLAFEEFKCSEEDFLKRLAAPEWGCHADDAVAAWKLFAEGYGHYPFSNMFQYYGPMHDGVVWPLHLFPENSPLAPTWRLECETSGDSIGECLENHTLGEAISLCGELVSKWNMGVDILKKIRPSLKDDLPRLKDIDLAEALGIQFESGYNILCFYFLRERLFNSEIDKQKDFLAEMKEIVKAEIKRSGRMISLCGNDSRLGFHSEAEGYKYYPEKLRWRIGLLEALLDNDFSEAYKAVGKGGLKKILPGNVKKYLCDSGRIEECGTFTWKVVHGEDTLSFELNCRERGEPDQIFIWISGGSTTFPVIVNLYASSGPVCPSCAGCAAKISFGDYGWNAEISIPLLKGKMLSRNPLRLNIARIAVINGEVRFTFWEGSRNPSGSRLNLGLYNPREMGLLFFNNLKGG